MQSTIRLTLLLAVIGAANDATSQPAVASDAPTSPSYRQYQPINDPKAFAFLQQALSFASELYGEPRIPVNRVILRFSLPLDPNSKMKSGFSLTELANAPKGVFVIYLSTKPDAYGFYGLLAHEVGHLLNAQLYDCYVEGLNTVFAERALKRRGLDWSGWEIHFRKAESPITAFYSATYFMMKDVSRVAGERHMKSLLANAKFSPEDPSRMHIDVEAWLHSLPDQTRQRVRAIILKHLALVQNTMGHMNERFVCQTPRSSGCD